MRSKGLSKKNTSELKTVVYYDGGCPICSREIETYRKKDKNERIIFEDISAPDFDPIEYGLDPKKIHKKMHARTPDDKIVTGVNAFITIWREIESLKFLVPLAQFRPIYLILSVGYWCFAKLRPLLPRKTCDSEVCFRDPK